HTEPGRDGEVEQPIPCFAHRHPMGIQFGSPDGGARSSSIARLIRAHTSRPSSSPRSHRVLKASGFKLGVGAVLPDQQICGAPNVEVGNHLVSLSSISREIMVLDLSDDEAATLAQLLLRTITEYRYPLSPPASVDISLLPCCALCHCHIKPSHLGGTFLLQS